MYARTARKLERVQRHERAGAVKYLVGTNIERVPDDTTDALTFVWRTREATCSPRCMSIPTRTTMRSRLT